MAASALLPPSSTAPARRNTPGPLANHPGASNDGAIAIAPDRSMRPSVGRMLYTPQKAAGIRTDPPVSLPSPMSQAPAAVAAAEPADEPPGRRPGARIFVGVP